MIQRFGGPWLHPSAGVVSPLRVCYLAGAILLDPMIVYNNLQNLTPRTRNASKGYIRYNQSHSRRHEA